MTTETRTNANAAVISTIIAAVPGAEWVRVGKKNMLVIASGVKDEQGNEVYVTVETTAKNTTATQTSPAFDVASAKAEYAEWVASAAEKATTPKAPKATDEEKAAKAAAKEANVKAICAWALENMEDGVEYTTTAIKEAVPGFEEVSILTLGGLMKEVVATALVNVEVKNGKKFYTKA